MKRGIALTLLSLVLPLAAKASPFEKHFGTYDVVSYEEASSPRQNCPLQVATIGRSSMDGYKGIVLEAKGISEGCNAQVRIGLLIQDYPGIDCEESESLLRCTQNDNRFEVAADLVADGALKLNIRSSGAYPSSSTWVLRRQ